MLVIITTKIIWLGFYLITFSSLVSRYFPLLFPATFSALSISIFLCRYTYILPSPLYVFCIFCFVLFRLSFSPYLFHSLRLFSFVSVSFSHSLMMGPLPFYFLALFLSFISLSRCLSFSSAFTLFSACTLNRTLLHSNSK